MATTHCLYLTPLAGDGTTGTALKVEFPAAIELQLIEDLHLRSRQQARAAAGGAYHVNYGAYRQLTLRAALPHGSAYQDFIDRLRAADSQLTMGALCHFSRNRSKSGVWPLNNSLGTLWAVPAQGDTTLYYTNTEELLGIDTTPAVAVLDDIVVETNPPESHLSYHRVSTRSTTQIGLVASNGILFDSSASTAVYHWEGFYPYLRLSEASMTRPRMRREGQMQWVWEVTFESEPSNLFDLITGAGP